MTVEEFKKNEKGFFIPEEIFYNKKLTPIERLILAVAKYTDIQFKNEKEEAEFYNITEKELKQEKLLLQWYGYLD